MATTIQSEDVTTSTHRATETVRKLSSSESLVLTQSFIETPFLFRDHKLRNLNQHKNSPKRVIYRYPLPFSVGFWISWDSPSWSRYFHFMLKNSRQMHLNWEHCTRCFQVCHVPNTKMFLVKHMCIHSQCRDFHCHYGQIIGSIWPKTCDLTFNVWVRSRNVALWIGSRLHAITDL